MEISPPVKEVSQREVKIYIGLGVHIFEKLHWIENMVQQLFDAFTFAFCLYSASGRWKGTRSWNKKQDFLREVKASKSVKNRVLSKSWVCEKNKPAWVSFLWLLVFGWKWVSLRNTIFCRVLLTNVLKALVKELKEENIYCRNYRRI